MCCERAINDRRWTKSKAERGRYVREGPCRRGIPRILNCRIVVGGNAIGDIERPEPCRVRVAEIRIVPGPGVGGEWICAKSSRRRRVPGNLLKRADMIGNSSAVEEAYGRHHNIVVGIERSSRRRQRRLRVGES